MPLYDYQCVDCHASDSRVAGLDDHTALCTACGGLMLRLDEDLFAPFFEEQERTAQALQTFPAGLAAARENLARKDPLCPWCTGPTPLPPPEAPLVSHQMCARHAAEFRAEMEAL